MMLKERMIDYLKRCQRDMTDQVILETGITREELAAMMFEMGAQYIESMNCGEQITMAFLRESLFWAWWRQQWHLKDEVFLSMNDHLNKHDRSMLYRHLHHQIDAYPDPVIWKKIHHTYEQMAQQVIEKAKKDEHGL